MNKIKKVLAALSLSLIQTTFNIGNQVKGIFVYNEKTSYCPYNQADHLVDGLLWHYDNKNKKAFFILARVVENKQFKFINNSQYLEDLKKNHFTEIDIDELRNNSDKNGGFDKYLYDSFINALYTNPRTSPKEQYPNVVESDFPLNNLAEYFDGYVNGDDYFFWRRIFSKSLDEQGPVQEPEVKILSKWENDPGNPFLEGTRKESCFKKDVLDNLNKNLILSHGSPATSEELDGHLSSLNSLRLINLGSEGRTEESDERLKNSGYVFTLICSDKNKFNMGSYIRTSKTKLFFKNKKLPIVVVSFDQKNASAKNCQDYRYDVYICPGRYLSSILARHYLMLREEDFIATKRLGANKFLCWFDSFGTSWPYECRIPTYLTLSDDDFYKPEE